jgi:hypothetical protein
MMYDAWCEDCCGYLHTVTGGVLVDEWESRSDAERVMSLHHGVHDTHYVVVSRVYSATVVPAPLVRGAGTTGSRPIG